MDYRFILLVVALVVTCTSSAQLSGSNQNVFGGKTSMNGHSLKEFGNFTEDWHLVTARFRTDTSEQRFTYANALAWNALKEKKGVFPDGAVFAKVGFATGSDPAFESSRIPMAVNRYQFMIKDSFKNRGTAGWEYVVFDGDGLTFPEDPKTQTISCAACHNLVPQRDYVFSELPNFVSHLSASTGRSSSPTNKGVQFQTLEVTALPALVAKWIPIATKKVVSVTGELQTNLFQGTIDEIRPTLAAEAVRTGLPAVLFGKDGKAFSMVTIDKESHVCRVRDPKLINMISVYTNVASSKDGTGSIVAVSSGIQKNYFCQEPPSPK